LNKRVKQLAEGLVIVEVDGKEEPFFHNYAAPNAT
jgi:hypothetical protein